MPIIDPYDPLSYPIGYDAQATATPLLFPHRPRTDCEHLSMLITWLTYPRWRQGGLFGINRLQARNSRTPECGCVTGALYIVSFAGHYPHWPDLHKIPTIERVVAMLTTELPVNPATGNKFETIASFNDAKTTTYSDIRAVLTSTLEAFCNPKGA